MKSNFSQEEGTKELIDQFETEYLQVGMEIMTSISRILILIVIIAALIFLSPEHPFYSRAMTLYPINFFFICMIDKYLSKSKKLTKIFIISTILFSGVFVLQGNLKGSTYSFYEIWLAFILYSQYFGILMFADWVKVVASFYTIVICFLVLVSKRYTDVPIPLYASFLFVLIYYPLICLFISQKYKEMIVLLKTNNNLVHTIQTILKVLPEGVLIRSFDPVTQKVITEFVNDYAQKFVKESNKEITISENLLINIAKSSASPPSNRFENDLQLNDFLNLQEIKIKELEDSFSEMVEIKDVSKKIEEWKEFVRNIQQSNSHQETISYYNIKSVKVRWMNKDSYVHMFINTTQVKKLAEERANRECQQIMFASLSHDMRTPLNAFTNSLQLLHFCIDQLVKSFTNYPKVCDSYHALEPRIEKYF